MGLREKTQHAKCATCLKYKLLIRKLSGDRAAQSFQQREYARHLARQYKDRTCYWASRSLSRLRYNPDGSGTLVIIVDSMDRAKFRFPRSANMNSKDLTNFNRPQVDLTACIAHGHYVFLALAEGSVLKNSSWSCELVSHVLDHVAQSGTLDLRLTDLIIQADNCSKEIKNMSMLRWASLLVSRHRLRQAELRFLQSGHSHEDIDASLFAKIHAALEAHGELHTPSQIRQLLEDIVGPADFRPHEAAKEVRILNRVRSWWPAMHYSFFWERLTDRV